MSDPVIGKWTSSDGDQTLVMTLIGNAVEVVVSSAGRPWGKVELGIPPSATEVTIPCSAFGPLMMEAVGAATQGV